MKKMMGPKSKKVMDAMMKRMHEKGGHEEKMEAGTMEKGEHTNLMKSVSGKVKKNLKKK